MKYYGSLIKMMILLIYNLFSSIDCIYFKLEDDREKCYVDELYKGSILAIKFDLVNLRLESLPNPNTIESLQIKVYNESSNTIIHRYVIRAVSGKYSLTIDEDGYYRICGQNVIPSWWNELDVYLRIKIETDISDEINFDKALKTDEVDHVTKKINKIIKKSKIIIDNQVREAKKEDDSSNSQMDYSRSLIFFTVIQIILVLSIGLCHFISFKNFLVHNHIIKK